MGTKGHEMPERAKWQAIPREFRYEMKKMNNGRLQNGIGITSVLAIVVVLVLLALEPGSLPGAPSPAVTTPSPSFTSGTTTPTTSIANGADPSRIATAPSSTIAPTSTSTSSSSGSARHANDLTGSQSNTAGTTATTIPTNPRLPGATISTTTTSDPAVSGTSAPTTTTTRPPDRAVSTTTAVPPTTTTTTTTTAPGGTPSSTVTEVFAPWTSEGVLAPGIQVTATLNDGSCSTASLADGADQNAWRCSSGNSVYDPCFAPPDESNVTQVACTQSPWSGVDVLTLVQPLASSSTGTTGDPGPAPVPWYIQLANGDQCGRTTGTASSAGGLSLSYACQLGSASSPNTSTEPWTVQYLPNNSQVVSDVAVITAWN